MLSFMSLSMNLIMMSDKKGGLCLGFKLVSSKPSLHREVLLNRERYGEHCNWFDVTEGFLMEQTYH